MINRKAQIIEMSFDVPSEEKTIAKKAIRAFNRVKNMIDMTEKHLDIIYNPFSTYDEVSLKSLYTNRGALIRFKSKAKENFVRLSRSCLVCIIYMNNFLTDTHMAELMKSFSAAIEDIEKKMEIFESVFDNFRSKEFRNNILKTIQGIKKQNNQLTKLIDERIIPHINANILVSNWHNNLEENLKLKIEEKIPAIKKLHLEREKQLNDNLESE